MVGLVDSGTENRTRVLTSYRTSVRVVSDELHPVAAESEMETHLLATAAEGKVQLVAGVSRDLVEGGLHAGNWLKEVAPIGGGGRPDLA